jgi:hypothetical protein
MYIIAAAHCCQKTKRQNINLQQKLKNFKKPKKKKKKFNLCYNVHEAEIDYIEDNKKNSNKVHFSIKKLFSDEF